MQRLWPVPSATSAGAPVDLPDVYAYPESLSRPYIRMNFVHSIDGHISVDGRSGGLGSPADKQVFGLLRQLADVILVGAGTARTENYRGARSWEALRQKRLDCGQCAVPPIAVVTRSADLDPASPLFTDTTVPPLVLTVAAAPAERVERLAAAGAEIIVVGDQRAEVSGILEALSRSGLHRVLCEGGPRLVRDFIAADAVDDWCLSISPLLVGGTGARTPDPVAGIRSMNLASVIEDDNVLLMRYTRNP